MTGQFVRAAARIDAATPAHRERAIDGYRALATMGVVLGHWLVGALVLHADGAQRIASPLSEMHWLAPASWVAQMLGLFFLVGGYAATLSFGRARERGESYGSWVSGRLTRLGRPVVVVLAVMTVAVGIGAALGVPGDSLRTLVVLVTQPLWFVVIYGVITSLIPVALWLSRRFGLAIIAVLMLIVAVGDLLRWGPWADTMPGWVAWVQVLPAWFLGFQLGVCWARGQVSRRAAWLLVVIGAGIFAATLVVFNYPVSMVGAPGDARNNSNPASLMVPALALVQSGAAILLRDRVERLMRTRRTLWAAVAFVNLAAMSIFCWHHVAMFAVSFAGGRAGVLPGLTDLPDSPLWLAFRLGWMAVMGVVLVLLVAAVRRYEGPWRGVGTAGRASAGVLAVAFAAYAVAVW